MRQYVLDEIIRQRGCNPHVTLSVRRIRTAIHRAPLATYRTSARELLSHRRKGEGRGRAETHLN